jgi:hypothetical protein
MRIFKNEYRNEIHREMHRREFRDFCLFAALIGTMTGLMGPFFWYWFIAG